MRVAFYANVRAGGVRRTVVELVRQFKRHGHTVDLYSRTVADPGFMDPASVADGGSRIAAPERGPIRRRLPLLRRHLDLPRLRADIAALHRAEEAIAARMAAVGYDLIFAHGENALPAWGGLFMHPPLLKYLPPTALYYCYEPVIRVLSEPPQPRPYDPAPATGLRRLRELWYQPAEAAITRALLAEDRANLQSAANVITSSFYNRETVMRLTGQNARVVYLGVDVDHFQPQPRTSGDYIISVGDLHQGKGFDFLIRALGRVAPQYRPRLVIVTPRHNAAEYAYLHALALASDVSLDVRVRVGDAELRDLYNGALLFAFTPLLEPFGLVALEAMACGLPVVAVKEAGPRETVAHGLTGLLAQRDEAEFADSLQYLLRDELARHTMGDRAADYVRQNWTWANTYRRLIDHVERPGAVPAEVAP